jgi:DNA-binding GntR family transcriptional regulator
MNAYEFIKNAIIQGTYEPGKRLTEEYLANELKVSRTPIREAVKQLEAEGLITPLKRGVIVRQFSKKDIRQIYDLRALLEGYAASQAAFYHTNDDIKKMIHSNLNFTETLKECKNDDLSIVNEIMNVNNKFHGAVLSATKNEHLRFQLSKVVVIPLVFRSFYWYNHQELIRSLGLHQTILDAIQNRDHNRAKTAMLEHVYQGRDHVLRHIEENIELEKGDMLYDSNL